MAAGNQAENGICALLVIAAKNTKKQGKKITLLEEYKYCKSNKLREPKQKNQQIVNNNAKSPNRLERTVTIPADPDFQF
jgi:uncharacterized surface protein with fasciclin (FAS1) repeats